MKTTHLYKKSWERRFNALPKTEQDLILASPDGAASAELARLALADAELNPNADVKQAFPKGRWS